MKQVLISLILIALAPVSLAYAGLFGDDCKTAGPAICSICYSYTDCDDDGTNCSTVYDARYGNGSPDYIEYESKQDAIDFVTKLDARKACVYVPAPIQRCN